MAQFTDCLKIAKFIARLDKKPSIGLGHLRLAMIFFEPEDDLRMATGGVPRVQMSPDQMDLAKAILDAHEAMPVLGLEGAVKTIREKFGDDELTERFNLKQHSTKDEIKAVRALTTADFEKTLKTYKPDDLAKAVEFGEKLRRLVEPLLDADFTTVQAATTIPVVEPVPTPVAAPAAAPAAVAASPSSPAEPMPVATSGLTVNPKLARLRELLHQELLDQPLAIRELVNELQARAWQLVPAEIPPIFLLVGPAASGKKLMAHLLGKAFGAARPKLHLNLATMTSRNEGFALTGVRASYEAARPGQLTGFVRQNPNAIVVLENFDQAHPNVQNLLVPLLAEGLLVDEYGFGGNASEGKPGNRAVSFKDTIVLLTTSLGSAVYERRDFPCLYEQTPSQAIALLREELVKGRKVFASDEGTSDPEEGGHRNALAPYLGLCRILPFKALGLDALNTLTRRSIDALKDRLNDLQVQLDAGNLDALSMLLTLAHGPDFNPIELHGVAGRVLLPVFMQDASSHGTGLPAHHLGRHRRSAGLAAWLAAEATRTGSVGFLPPQ